MPSISLDQQLTKHRVNKKSRNGGLGQNIKEYLYNAKGWPINIS
jgi:hypothetical protein